MGELCLKVKLKKDKRPAEPLTKTPKKNQPKLDWAEESSWKERLSCESGSTNSLWISEQECVYSSYGTWTCRWLRCGRTWGAWRPSTGRSEPARRSCWGPAESAELGVSVHPPARPSAATCTSSSLGCSCLSQSIEANTLTSSSQAEQATAMLSTSNSMLGAGNWK